MPAVAILEHEADAVREVKALQAFTRSDACPRSWREAVVNEGVKLLGNQNVSRNFGRKWVNTYPFETRVAPLESA